MTDTDQMDVLNAALADELGHVLTPAWRAAMLATPRHAFVPDQATHLDDATDEQTDIDRDNDAVSWLELIYTDGVIITHRNEEDGGHSSVSMPTMVFTMFDYLDLRAGDRYLEIGTGPGWTASLAASRLGDPAAVFTVEVSPEVARFGRNNMDSLGLQGINTLCADGGARISAVRAVRSRSINVRRAGGSVRLDSTGGRRRGDRYAVGLSDQQRWLTPADSD